MLISSILAFMTDICCLGYIVEGMCSHFRNWKEGKEEELINRVGKPVKNSEGFMKLKREVEELSMIGVQVAYYVVGREDNQEADALAKTSV